jgi:hypothetical protein
MIGDGWTDVVKDLLCVRLLPVRLVATDPDPIRDLAAELVTMMEWNGGCKCVASRYNGIGRCGDSGRGRGVG